MATQAEIKAALALIAASKETEVPKLKTKHALLTKQLREVEAELATYGETAIDTPKAGRPATAGKYTPEEETAVREALEAAGEAGLNQEGFAKAIGEFNPNKATKKRDAMEAAGVITVSKRTPNSGAIPTTIKLKQ